MAADLLLKVNKEDYMVKIGELDQKIAALRDLAGRYQTLKNNVNMFVEDSDSNFTKLQDNVQANVEAVQRAIAITQKSRETLQKTVDQMESMSAKAGAMMTEAADVARNAVKTAIRIEEML